MNNTKEKILDVSLMLFAENGFSGVSIRDICKQVKIKESSVYYHFKNKQAILDEIIFRFQEIAQSMMSKLDNSLSDNTLTFESDFYQNVCNCFFEEYLMNDFCNKVMRLLAIEQLSDDEIQKIYDRWIFKEPIMFQSKVFSALMEMGVIKKTDSDYLAVKYYAPIFFFSQRWLLTGKLTEENKNLFRMNAYGHMQKFFTELEVN